MLQKEMGIALCQNWLLKIEPLWKLKFSQEDDN